MPIHITGATAGNDEQVRRHRREREALEVVGDQRRRRHRRRERHRGAVGERARAERLRDGRAGKRARRSVARCGPAQSMIPATAAKLSCQPTSPPKRGLTSSVSAPPAAAGRRGREPAGERRRGSPPHPSRRRAGSTARRRRPARRAAMSRIVTASRARSPIPNAASTDAGEDREQDHVLAARRRAGG